MMAEPHVHRVGPNRWWLQATLARPWGGADAGRPVAILLDTIEAITFPETGGAHVRLTEAFIERDVALEEGWPDLHQVQSLIARRRPAPAA